MSLGSINRAGRGQAVTYRGNVTSAQQRGDDRNVVRAGSWGGKTQDIQLRGKNTNEFLLKHRACCFPKGFFARGKRNGSNAKVISHSSLSTLSGVDLALLGAGRGREISFLKPFLYLNLCEK